MRTGLPFVSTVTSLSGTELQAQQGWLLRVSQHLPKRSFPPPVPPGASHTTEPSALMARTDDPAPQTPVTRNWIWLELTCAAVTPPVAILSVTSPLSAPPVSPEPEGVLTAVISPVPTSSGSHTTEPSALMTRMEDPAAQVPVTRNW